MALIKVTAQVADYSGNVGNVKFEQGVGFADSETHAAELQYMRANGYALEDPETGEPVEDEPAEADETEGESDDEETEGAVRPPRNGSTEAWRAYAVANGLSVEEADALTRDQLVERFDSEENS